MIRILTFLLILSSLICSCNRKVAKRGTSINKALPNAKLLELIDQNSCSFEWMSSKLNMDYEDAYTSIGLRGNIIIRKDSVIWMNLTKLGFEVARVLITPDSITALNRLEKTYIKEGLDFFNKKYKVEANYLTLEQILSGNMLWLKDADLKISNDTMHYTLTQETSRLSLKQKVLYPIYKPTFMQLKQKYGERHLKVDFDKIMPSSAGDFPYLRNIEINDNSNNSSIAIEVEFGELIFDEFKKIKFDIPSRYTRVSI